MLETERCILREANIDDTDFILALINQPAWKKYISNHNINTPALAQKYIQTKLCAAYKKYDVGLWVVQLKDSMTAVGLCGLVKRDSLNYFDLGFGFLPEYWGQGLAYETSRICLNHAFKDKNLQNIAAITSPNNNRSINLLERLGFQYQGFYSPPGSEDLLSLYKISFL